MAAKTFHDYLKGFVRSTALSMKYAEKCAQLGLEHFAECGDVVYCQAFLDAMPKNYVRRAAYMKWLFEFSPIIYDEGKLVKDKGKDARELRLKEAFAEPFWDFAPDPEIVQVTQQAIINRLKGVLKSYHNEKRFKTDKASEKLLAAAEKKIGELENVAA